MSKKCDECKRCAINDDMTKVVMSSADWQRNEQRHLRREKRFVAIIVLIILLLVGSNMAWLIYENSFDDMTETYTVEIDGTGTNNSVINGGVIN